MNLTFILSMLVTMAKPLVQKYGSDAHEAVERAVTIPKNDRAKLLSGMSAEDQVEGERLLSKMSDAVSDATVFLASRGAIPAD